MDSGMVKEAGERHSSGMWLDFLSWWRRFHSPLLCYFLTGAEAGSQGRHLLITMGWQPPVIPAVQATQWSSAPQYCQVQHYKHLSHGRRSKNVLFSWTRRGDWRESSYAGFCFCCVKPLHHQCFWTVIFRLSCMQTCKLTGARSTCLCVRDWATWQNRSRKSSWIWNAFPTCQIDRNPQAEQSNSYMSHSSAVQKEPVCSVETHNVFIVMSHKIVLFSSVRK